MYKVACAFFSALDSQCGCVIVSRTGEKVLRLMFKSFFTACCTVLFCSVFYSLCLPFFFLLACDRGGIVGNILFVFFSLLLIVSIVSLLASVFSLLFYRHTENSCGVTTAHLNIRIFILRHVRFASCVEFYVQVFRDSIAKARACENKRTEREREREREWEEERKRQGKKVHKNRGKIKWVVEHFVAQSKFSIESHDCDTVRPEFVFLNSNVVVICVFHNSNGG